MGYGGERPEGPADLRRSRALRSLPAPSAESDLRPNFRRLSIPWRRLLLLSASRRCKRTTKCIYHLKPERLVRLQVHQDFGHSLSVRPFAELSDRVRSDDGGGSQVPKEVASLVDAQALRRDVLHANSGRHTRQYAPPKAGGQSRCLSSTFSRTAGSCIRRGRVAEATPASLATSNAVAFDSTLVYGPNSTQRSVRTPLHQPRRPTRSA